MPLIAALVELADLVGADSRSDMSTRSRSRLALVGRWVKAPSTGGYAHMSPHGPYAYVSMVRVRCWNRVPEGDVDDLINRREDPCEA
jgi:hypothetical protein